jgi:AcrR family transcriptional regulator
VANIVDAVSTAITRRSRRGPTKGDRKEAAILDTAWTLLGRQALASITVEDLARGAGISRSAFYFYFDSRDAVIGALSERVAADIRGATAAFFATTADGGRDDLRTAVAAYLDRWRTHGAVLRAMAALSEHDDDLRAFWDEVATELLADAAAAIDRARAEGRAAPAPPAAADLARVLFAMLWRTGYELSMEGASKRETARRVDAVTTVIARAVVGPAA